MKPLLDAVLHLIEPTWAILCISLRGRGYKGWVAVCRNFEVTA